jgi:FkbM family methyltransferase
MNKENNDLNGKTASEEVYELPNNMVIHHLNKSETDFLYKEIFENHSYMKHGISLREGAVVFDIGANIGMFTLFIKETVNKSKVYVFEPIPEVCQLLRLNTAKFNSEVVVYENGVSNKNKTAVFTYYPGYSILSGAYANQKEDSQIFISGAERQWRTAGKKQKEMPERIKELLLDNALGKKVEHECKLTTISSIVTKENISQIDLLKVDVEKSELDILDGIDPEDWSKIKQIVMEVHDFKGGLSEKIDALLKEKGFTTIIDEDEQFGSEYTPNIYARRK